MARGDTDRVGVWPVVFFAMSALVVIAASLSPALASCGNRPGTPTSIRTKANVGSMTLLWHDTTKPGEGSCHDIEVRGADGTDPAISLTGDVCLTGGTDGSYEFRNVIIGRQYCFRIKARDHAGTEGCTSEQWSARVCDAALPPSGPGIGSVAEFMPGIDLPGFDIPESAGGRISTLIPVGQAPNLSALAQDCRNRCNRHPRCVAWTSVKPGVQGQANVCYLKSEVPALVRSSCCTSGNKIVVDTDFPGNDLLHFSFVGMNYLDCETKCGENNRCSAWTFVKAGVQGANPVCYLKGELPNAFANTCCTSGKVR